MDPLSISASIVALLQLSTTVIGYLSDVKDGPKELHKIRLEISQVLSILIMLQDEATRTEHAESCSPTLISLNVPNGPFEQFRQALERLAAISAPSTGLKKMAKAVQLSFKKGEVLEILNNIERHKPLFSLARRHDHIALSTAIRKDIAQLNTNAEKTTLGFIDIQKSEWHRKIREWLAAPDPSSNYNNALKTHHINTGDWFFKTDAYATWLSKPSSLLWLYGIPGSGKTVLSSSILKKSLSDCQTRPNSIVLYFYFDFRDTEKQRPDRMLRSLVSQLSSQSATQDIAKSLFSECGNGERQPSQDSLLETLHKLMGCFQKITLIIDALDECVERLELLSIMNVIVGWEDINLHLLATSRREADIQEAMESYEDNLIQVSIQSTAIKEDMRAYVHSRIRSDPTMKKWRDKPEIQSEIEDVIVSKADGMFRWAVCQLDELRHSINLTGLRKTLANLPGGLDETYDRMLANIPDQHAEDACNILQWLCVCRRLLSLVEVADLLAVDQQLLRYDSELRLFDMQDILKLCPSLISLVNFEGYEANHVELSHMSVKDYLFKKQINIGTLVSSRLTVQSCNENLARTLLAYLFQFEDRHVSENDDADEIYTERRSCLYAFAYWTQHNAIARPAYVRMPKLEFACRKDLMPTTQLLLEDGVSASVEAMREAVYNQNIALVQLLLDHGANPEESNTDISSLLSTAILNENETLAQMLIENRAYDDLDNALFEAITWGMASVVESLLRHGADFNAVSDSYTAVCFAVGCREYQIVQILLNFGADANALSSGKTPLELAEDQGFDDIAQLLRDRSQKQNALIGEESEDT